MTKLIPIFIVILSISSCQNKTKENVINSGDKEFSLDLSAISKKMIELADLHPKEKVLLVMAPGHFDEIVGELKAEIVSKNAQYLGTISVSEAQPDDWSTPFTREGKGKNDTQLAQVFKDVDLGIMLPGAGPMHQPYKVLQGMLEESNKRTIHFHWAGAYDLNGNLLTTDADKSEFYQNVILNTDYKKLGQAQKTFEDAMRNSTVRVTTKAGTDINFEIGDRPVTKQDGDASAKRAAQGLNLIDKEIEIPSGAIRVAPIEESVNGTIAFPDADWAGEKVKGLIVTIKAGKIVNIEAKEGKDAVLQEMEKAGEAGKYFREFALGFNPMMPIQEAVIPWIPYYGYGAGVVRLSLGDNTELGGVVSGGYVRWNFFPDATVMVGDEIWVENGILLK
ncbi:MAG: aminopeptidase [Saprospiraceae bacterium]